MPEISAEFVEVEGLVKMLTSLHTKLAAETHLADANVSQVTKKTEELLKS